MDENKNLTLTIDFDTSKAEKKAEELKKKIESANVNVGNSSNASSGKDSTSSNITKTGKEAKKVNSEFSSIKRTANEINSIFGTKLTRSISSLLNRISNIMSLANKIKTNNVNNINNTAKTLQYVSRTSDATANLANNMQNVKEEVKEAAGSASELQKQILAAAKASNDFEFDEDYDDGDIDIDEYNAMQEALSKASNSTDDIANNMSNTGADVIAATKGMGTFKSAAGEGAIAMNGVATSASSASGAVSEAATAIGAAAPALAVAFAAILAVVGAITVKISLFLGKLTIAKKTAELLFKGILQFAKNVVKVVQAGIEKIGQLISDLKNKIISLGSYISKMIEVSLSGGDYIENVNLIENVFGEASDKIIGSLKEIRKEFGVNTITASKYLGTLGLRMREMTKDEDELADYSIVAVERIADIASQANVSFEDVAADFSSGLVGMVRVLDKYGVNIREEAINQSEFAKALGKTYKQMSQSEKMQARFAKFMEDTAVAYGDFARTSNSWNNVLKTIQNQFKELTMLIGQGLIVIFSKTAIAVRDILDKLISKVKIIVTALAEVFNFDLSSIEGNVKDSTEGVNDLTDGVEDLTKKVNDKKLVAGFDNLYSLTREASDSMSDLSSASNLNFGSLLGKDKKLSKNLFELSPDEKQQLDEIKGVFESIKGIVERIITQIKTAYTTYLQPAISLIKEQIIDVAPDVGTTLEDIFNKLINISSKLLDNVLGIIGGLNLPEKIKEDLNWLDTELGIINGDITKMNDEWTDKEKEKAMINLNTIIDIGRGLVKNFLTGIRILFIHIVNGVSTLLRHLSTDDNFKTALDSLKTSADNLGEKWKTLCDDVGTYIEDWLSSDKAVEVMTTAVNALSIAMDGLSKVLELVNKWIPKIIEAYKKLPQGIKDVLWNLIVFLTGNKIGGGGIKGLGTGLTLMGIFKKAKEETTGKKDKSGDVILDTIAFAAGNSFVGGGINGKIAGWSLANMVDKTKKSFSSEQIDKNTPVWAQGLLPNAVPAQQNPIVYNIIEDNRQTNYNPGIVNSGGSGKPNASASSSKAAKIEEIRRKYGQ